MSTEFSYDTIPYPSKFFLQTHPDRLAAAATLYGMQPKAIESCRVLELGCGNGSNLISHAYGLPYADFVGVDLSEKHIAKAKSSAAELGLSNIAFHQMDVMAMTADDFGEFDYITAHGLFSWVPKTVREKVLSLFNEMLSANGVGYVSYNAYPGAYLREMVRSMMLFHTRGIDDPLEKVEKAIPFLGMLAKNSSERELHGRILEFELKRHSNHYPADIYHDDLAEFYQPFYFHEFVSLLAENDLQFLSEAELHASGIQGFGEDAINSLNSMDDPILREQYLDFLRGRIFRQTLFCRDDVMLDRKPEPSVMDKFFVSSSLRPIGNSIDIASPKVEKFASAKGHTMQIDHPLAKAALLRLGQLWGRSIATTELLNEARNILSEQNGAGTIDWDAQFNIAKTILLQICLSSDLVELHVHQPTADTEAGEKPAVNKLSRWQLGDANNVLTLLNKDLKLNDETARHLLVILDGTRTKTDMIADMKAFISANDSIEDKQQLIADLPSWIDESVTELARLGVFEA